MNTEIARDKLVQEMSEIGLIEKSRIFEAEMYIDMALAVGFSEGMKKCTVKREIAQYTEEGKLIAQYDSITDASRIVGINLTSIQKTISKKHPQKTAGGFVWKYKTV